MLAIVLYIIIPILCLLGVRKRNSEENALTKEATLAMRGLGMLFIIFTHMAQRNICTETYFFYVSGVIGVGICFLVSGYGLHISYKKKSAYLKRFWTPKILRLLLPFLAAFTYYWLSMLIRKENVELSTVLKSLVTITFPGVTLWYLKIQLLMYAVFYITYRFIKSTWMKIGSVFAIAVVYSVIAGAVGMEMFWYNTCLFFPLGLCVAEYQDQILPFVRKNWVFIVAGGISTGLYAVLYFFGRMNLEWIIDNVYMFFFCIGLMWIVQRFANFRILEILGKYSIEIYLFHIAISGECFSPTNPVAYILTPLICVLIAIPVHWGTDRVMRLCCGRKSR